MRGGQSVIRPAVSAEHGVVLSTPAALLVMAVCILALALNHQYRGIFHDGRLYLLQALAHLDQGSLTQSVFLRYGSQDRYTLFSLPVAALIRFIGAEQAAAVVTLASQAALLAGAWLLARAIVPRALALLGVASLIAFPGTFGMRGVFMVIEPFLSPRMGAEALVLAALAAALKGRKWLALLLVALAALCHPLMAAGGIVALLCWYVVMPWPRLSLAALVAGAIALLVASGWSQQGVLARFDSDWLGLLSRRSPILFLANWSWQDWSRLAPIGATLIAGLTCLPLVQGRRLCAAVAMTVLGALVLTGIACDGLHLVLFTQMQPWRWQWLGYSVAALLLPAILVVRWRGGAAGQQTALLLVAAWVFGDYPGSILVAALAVSSLWITASQTARQARILWLGAAAVLAVACAWRIASNLEFGEATFIDSRLPAQARRLIGAVADGSLWLALIGLICWADTWNGWLRRTAWLALGSGALALGVSLAPMTLGQWTRVEFTAAFRDALAPFRAQIPSGTPVLWDGPSTAAWVLLDRPNYLVPAETAGMLYSREAAIEMERRARVLGVAIPADEFLAFDAPLELDPSAPQLLAICRIGEIHFIVTYKTLGFSPLSTIGSGSLHAGAGLNLYACPPAA
jgi:hypothetical protein